MNTLELQNLSKSYSNGTLALNSINLKISNGMFGLLGPNGAGKSSLMRTIASLQEPSQGKVLFNKKSVSDHPDFLRASLGYLPQEFGVFPKLSAKELLNHIAILKGIGNKHERTQQIDFLLNQTNLYSERNKAVSTYSGGMKQRFGIAQALLGNPQLIIVDEPTAGLDPEERNRFLNLLSEVGENRIVILSTHLVDDVQELCAQMAILFKGKLFAQGNPQILVEKLKGKIWSKRIEKSELKKFSENHKVLSKRLNAGQTWIRVFSEFPLEGEFIPEKPQLEDFYFYTLQINS
ncbi:ABC transporter ATP-binding protein [Algoriphagus sp. PAP.12]|uniref:ABC transporter ATP-binding protein n=1 Tax=Algoriphagus sp. PAP.12 TaxID=2996678 RepID=UPI00227A15C5|nr:ABC transporter ATP-binding protein [Algoriphagus sp. PAP.12]